MRRIIFCLIILLILFGLTFVISLQSFPYWYDQSSWAINLSKNIFIAGLVIIAEAIISWLVSFLFEDKDFSERLKFSFGSKYKKISTALDKITQIVITKEKTSKKYIPNIFIESNEIKEKLRYFCEPSLFFPKITEEANREIRTSFILQVLDQLHYPHNTKPPLKLRSKKLPDKKLKRAIETYIKNLDDKETLLEIFLPEHEVGIKPELLKNIPTAYSHIYQYVYANLQFYSSYKRAINQAREDISLLSSKFLILASKAGHGKTNLLCDFTDNFLLRKKHKCIYLPAREFNNMATDDQIEQQITKIIFSDSDIQFSDIQRLLTYDKKIDFLFILIDGINEHKDIGLFSTALEQFANRCSGQKIKMILTCRSEYFDERFANLLQIQDLSKIDMDEWKYINQIPKVHSSELISRYFSEFKIKMNSGDVDSDIEKIFFEDKLLLRIFCEAYENEKPAAYLDNLYKLEIFYKYYEKKKSIIKGLDKCLDEISSLMVGQEKFSNIPLSTLTNDTQQVIEKTAYENVIIRKDIVLQPGVAFGKFEVINFVYDEFRDFIIASIIINKWRDENKQAQDLIRKFTMPKSEISEGLQRYLCLWAIRNNQNDLFDFLSQFSWFNIIFIESVFDSPEKFLTETIAKRLQYLFLHDATSALHLIFHLSRRIDFRIYPLVNLDLILSVFDNFSTEDFDRILSTPLNHEIQFQLTYIAHLCHQIYDAFSEDRVREKSYPYLIQLLCYLSGTMDKTDPRFRGLGFTLFPAYETLLRISDLHKKQEVIIQAKLVLCKTNVKPVQDNLQRLLEILGEK